MSRKPKKNISKSKCNCYVIYISELLRRKRVKKENIGCRFGDWGEETVQCETVRT